jgi:hypothetical protein
MALITISVRRPFLPAKVAPGLTDKKKLMMNEDDTGTGAAAVRNRRSANRLLCSDLITVRWAAGRGIVRQEAAVIEDYSPVGASLSIEIKIEQGTAITLQTEWESFGALVVHCQWRDHGYLLGIEFDQPRLDDDSFVPDHLLDPNELSN